MLHLRFLSHIAILIAASSWISGCNSDNDAGETTDPVTSTPVTATAPVTAASATLGFDIKTFRFTWTDVTDATHYRLLENPDGSSGFSQVGSDIAPGTQTIDHIVPLYKRINASYILQSCNSTGCTDSSSTDSSSLDVTGTLVDAIGYFKASNTGSGDAFGGSVSLSANGNTLAVGANEEASSTSGINTTPDDLAASSGAVYIFSRNGSTWSEQAYIKASNTGADDKFGNSVSLSSDGNTLAVGANEEDSSTSGINTTPDDLAASSGAVYVFSRNGGSWSEQAYVKASNTGTNDFFGTSVSLSADGNSLAVGATGESSSTSGIDTTPDELAAFSGAVYVFSRNASSWSEQAYVKAGNTGASDFFGTSVSLNSDGNTLAVGALGESSSTSGINTTPDESASFSGAVYVFSRSGSSWSQQAYVKAGNTGASDFFGTSVSLSADGNTLAVGAQVEDSSTIGINTIPDELATSSGAVYVFSRNGSNWSEQAYVKASNTDAGDVFGISVSLSADGNTLAVGADEENSNTSGISTTPDELAGNSGAVYVFSRNGSSWLEQAYVKASNAGADDAFGTSVSLSADGNTLAVGATGEGSSTSGMNSTPDESAASSGAVYVN